MTDEAEALTAHVTCLALAHEVLVPARKIIDAAPGDLFLSRHEAGHAVGCQHTLALVAEVVAGDELDFERPPNCTRARRSPVVMVCDAVHDPETDAAVFVEFQRLGPAIDEARHALLVEEAAREKPHISDDVVPT